MRLACLTVLLPLLACANNSDAQYSGGVFDFTRKIALHGTVRSWEMSDPHGHLWIDVKNKQGQRVAWDLEAPGAAVLARNVWNKYTVKVGDQVTVRLNPRRDGRIGGNLKSIRFADGRLLNTAPIDLRSPAVPHTVSPAPRELAR